MGIDPTNTFEAWLYLRLSPLYLWLSVREAMPARSGTTTFDEHVVEVI